MSDNNPRPFLSRMTGSIIAVKLKWGMEYRGQLLSVDGYMNLKLTEAEEFIDEKCQGKLGDVVIRCNNILYIRQLDDDEKDDDKEDEDTKDKGDSEEDMK